MAWYLNDIKGISAQAKLLGDSNTEAAFVLNRWNLEKPAILTELAEATKGAALSCILSDTLEFRSPATTDHDHDIANKLASELGIDIPSYASEMFEAKSDISTFSDAELLRMDSKEYAVGHTKFRVSVLETTAPKLVLDRKYSLMTSMRDVADQDGDDQVLLFVIDILREEATFFVPNDLVKTVSQNSFGVDVSGDTVVLSSVMSRKKQIIPPLSLFLDDVIDLAA